MGDFNCAKINRNQKIADHEGQSLLDLINDNLLTQQVNDPTRGDKILNLVLTSEDELIKNKVLEISGDNSNHNFL